MDKIAELKNKMFMLQMNDHWSRDDYKQYDEWRKELKQLEKERDLNDK